MTAAVGVAVAIGACGEDEPPVGAGGLPASYEIPGERVFPEGIGLDKDTGDFYVTSSQDGTVFRGNVRRERMEVFLPPGGDGRTQATGVRARDGRLWVAGRFTGRLFVYDLRSRRLVKRMDAPRVEPSFSPRAEPSLLNDIGFAGDAAYVTDSFQPVIYRVSTAGGRIGELEPWLDLRDSPITYRRGFNLNGISASDDERYLVTVNTDSGELFRIDVSSKEIEPIDLGGATVKTGDGVLVDGTTVLVVREEPGEITPVKLSADLLRGEIGQPFGRDLLRYPTTMSELDGRGLVVNSQFDAPAAPQLPFTVASVPIPPGTLPRR